MNGRWKEELFVLRTIFFHGFEIVVSINEAFTHYFCLVHVNFNIECTVQTETCGSCTISSLSRRKFRNFESRSSKQGPAKAGKIQGRLERNITCRQKSPERISRY